MENTSGGIGGEPPGVRRIPEPDDLTRRWWGRFVKAARRMRGAGWQGCEVCEEAERDPNAWTEVHHVIAQQRLKRYARENDLPAKSLLALLTDPRNSIVVCKRHHGNHTVRVEPIPMSAIPDAAWEFAKELGLEDEMLKEYRRE